MSPRFKVVLSVVPALLLTTTGAAAAETATLNIHMSDTLLGFAALAIFVVAYCFVMAEEFTHLRKSKPVLFAAGVVWAMIAWHIASDPQIPNEAAEEAFRHVFLEFAELFGFLIVAMTYINSMAERNVFEALRSWLVRKGFGLRQVFWVTGILAFFISPIADNLTTALLMCAVTMAVGAGNTKFISLACINIVVAANAGGAFSPFGDITTLMVWQAGKVGFFEFFAIFLPSVVNFLIPAAIMHFAVPNEQPHALGEDVAMKIGAKRIVFLFLLTIAITVAGHQALHMPPVYGMLFGLSFLKFFAFYLKKTEQRMIRRGEIESRTPFDVFQKIAQSEWDTLFFFCGVLLCVGGLATIGYLEITSETLYGGMPHTVANAVVGVLSAIVDNIPVMFAVITMSPPLDQGQWLLVTLTAGVGGSLLSVGSAAGVALMGQARGIYTFFGHLKWAWAIMLGYIASIALHLWLNGDLFTNGMWISGVGSLH
jgi:Na+/H+ antiporter NhaD/arsenite permease-like protein